MPSFISGITPGDTVRVIAGYFKDLEGLVKSCDADGRAVVELREGEGTFKARFLASQIERASARPSAAPAE
ncbi:MAG TPA: KOW motif-containing protein [Chloroflexota bacterium]|nr:KOW motif-containing protein [Chloroflexota bacterium]